MMHTIPKTLALLFLVLMVAAGTAVASGQQEGGTEQQESQQTQTATGSLSEYGEAPMLSQLVAAGELPPVDERLPKEPLVAEVADRIGDYGGTLFTGGAGGIDGWGEDHMVMDVTTAFVLPNAEVNGLRMNLAKDIEINEDKTEYTVYLREGTRWSDGEPFTTEDVMFWYEGILLNSDLTPSIPQVWQADGQVVDVNVIDDFTFTFTFVAPKPFFMNFLPHNGVAVLAPKHYLSQYHPDYAHADELAAKVDEAGFDNWWELFGDVNTRQMHAPLRVGLPTLGTYHLVGRTSSRRVYERNPYFWKVDPEGNQLPYIDRIETEIVSNKEVLNGQVISGEIDFLGWSMDIRNYTMFKSYEESGGFRTLLWEAGFGATSIYMLNQTVQDPGLREVFQNADFRRALSLAVNREEINESVYFGQAVPRQYTVIDSSTFYEPEFETAYIEYDPDRAEEILESIGVVDRDGDGWRERPDGEDLSFTIEFFATETPKGPEVEIVAENWRAVGVQVEYRQISAALQGERAPANLMDATIWHGDRATDIIFFQARKFVPIVPHWGSSVWPEWARWFNTNGDSGWEPPQHIKDHYNAWLAMQTEPDDERRIALGKQILRNQAENLYVIGTVGEAPWPIVINSRLHNVPEHGIWVWDSLWTASHNPGTFFFEGGSRD